AICLKVGDGVVLGTDSAASLIGENERYFNVYNTAEKTFNLVKGLPIGMMTFGLGGMAGLSIGALARDLRKRLSGEDPRFPEWALDPHSYTIEQVAHRVKQFFYDELYQDVFGPIPVHRAAEHAPGSDAARLGDDENAGGSGQAESVPAEEPGRPADDEVEGTPGELVPEFPVLGFVVAGISAQDYYTEVWTVQINEGRCDGPTREYERTVAGVVNFWGEAEALYRLVYGWSPEAQQRLVSAGVPPETADRFLVSRTELAHTGMPIQDAIDLVRYLAEVTVGYVRFKQGAPTVAPPIDIAAITRHQGFKWVSRKHFYSQELNPG
ncbi:MAG TPA: hypothetical protein VLK84_30940, partial [Longimicrobium sp.]|nr:hypothetical protein [Longimicrobium sp.]